jgi:hypothetical protein
VDLEGFGVKDLNLISEYCVEFAGVWGLRFG